MKYLFFIFILTVTCISAKAQKLYKFDYLITYERYFSGEDSTKSYPVSYLTNSKDNSYLAKITYLHDNDIQIIFFKRDVIYANVKTTQQELIKAETISIPCSAITKLKNSHKHLTKNYYFTNLKDTIINNLPHAVYTLQSNYKPRKKRRKKIGKNIYIVDKSTNYHLPILTFSTAYEEWLEEKNIPNGIITQRIYVNHLNKIGSINKLKNIYKIDKKILIPKECWPPKIPQIKISHSFH
ncbi:hypothetical protein [Mangrovimonas spongiae]|uniref:DUF4412 domain-containing protein n=1 Tax=Mangrovimonas spongiae TaxID=2494697 RepID=A0A428K0G0_9FLAO|nr:hypothetical protein [Mangrovimonas spongiae]RSK39863.1 hypothetical protein EJA19_08250 [Mangrovimonas spongiae]